MATNTVSTTVSTRTRSTWQVLRTLVARSPEAGAFIGFLALFVFFSIRATQDFLSGDSIASILNGQVTIGIVAVGVTMLMISGEFDLSVGSMLAVSSLVFLSLVMNNVPAVIAAIAAVLAGATMGLINGLILVLSRIPSFIVTLGTLQAYRAIALTAIRGGTILRYTDYDASGQPWLYFHPLVIILLMVGFIVVGGFFGVRAVINFWQSAQKKTGMDKLGPLIGMIVVGVIGLELIIVAGLVAANQLHDTNSIVRVSFFDLVNGRLSDLSQPNFRTTIFWWQLIIVVFTVILGQTRYGSATYATGGNPGAAKAQGIAIDRVRVMNFVICGILAGVAGVIAVGRQESVNPTDGVGLELDVIAAAVIGGTLLNGGFGTIIGATLGVLITGVLRTGLVLISVPPEAYTGYIGVILIATVILNTAVRRLR